MFEYAAGHALAARLGVPLRLDAGRLAERPDRPYGLHALNVPERPEFPVAGRWARFGARLGRKFAWPGSRTHREAHFHYDPSFASLNAPVVLEGHFQSWRYFAGHETAVHQCFGLRAKLCDQARAILGQIEAVRTPVSLHVRRGDYLTPRGLAMHGVLPPGYYDQAIDLMRTIVASGVSLFVFADDPDWVRSELMPRHDLVMVPGNPERPWEDLHLMARCHHHIIANSSFSWWGAWLNQREKTVIAPRNWFSSKAQRQQASTRDLFPPGWTVI